MSVSDITVGAHCAMNLPDENWFGHAPKTCCCMCWPDARYMGRVAVGMQKNEEQN